MKTPRIVLPRGAKPRHRCEVPGCGEVFWEPEQMVRHVIGCVKRNREAIEQAAEINRSRDPLDHVADEEAIEYQRRKYGLF